MHAVGVNCPLGNCTLRGDIQIGTVRHSPRACQLGLLCVRSRVADRGRGNLPTLDAEALYGLQESLERVVRQVNLERGITVPRVRDRDRGSGRALRQNVTAHVIEGLRDLSHCISLFCVGVLCCEWVCGYCYLPSGCIRAM